MGVNLSTFNLLQHEDAVVASEAEGARQGDIDVTLLSPYKKRIVGFRFKNCWIKSFSDLQLAYDGADEIQHSFTCAYTNFVILDLNGLESQIKSPVAKDARE